MLKLRKKLIDKHVKHKDSREESIFTSFNLKNQYFYLV